MSQTWEEVCTLLRSIGDPAFRELIIFAVSTMMRRGEILNLAWEDIDFERQVIHVRNKPQFVVKGYKPRVIPMNEGLCRMLSKRKLESGFVLAKQDGLKLRGSSVSNKFKSFVRKCKLPEPIHFHSLRHTGASWLIQQDVPIYSVQKLLGHSSPAVTQIYAHLSDHSLRRAVDLIGIHPQGLLMN